ncbi:MAG: YhdT family protein [Lachnospiraceae bacterium]|nr:YhdT family protein [Lachnospiraceae bacterium]
MQKMSYKEKFVQMNKEAKATWIAAAIVIAFWWITGFGIYGASGATTTILGMPAWFMVSCFGSWFLSIALVWFLITKVFVNFDLDDETPMTDVSSKDHKEVM